MSACFTPRRYPPRGFQLRDLLILLVCLCLAATWLLHNVRWHRDIAWGVKCASQLRQISEAMTSYGTAHRQAWPRTRWDPEAPLTQFTGGTAKEPFSADGPAANDVTAALWLLVRTHDLPPQAFYCPLARGSNVPRPLSLPAAKDRCNFPDPAALHYSVANPYPDRAAVKGGYRWNANQNPEFAVMADMNPGAPALKATMATPATARVGNTRNHDLRSGQNVLFGDGHVAMDVTPFVGVGRDNIYTYGAVTATSGGSGFAGPPAHHDDSILLPAGTFDGGTPTSPYIAQRQRHKAVRVSAYASGTGAAIVAFVMVYRRRRWIFDRVNPPAQWLLDRIRPSRRWRRLGLCPRCGYDLRATPDHCPECGWTRETDLR